MQLLDCNDTRAVRTNGEASHRPMTAAVELRSELALDARQVALLDLHTFLNLLNICLGQLYVLRIQLGRMDAWPRSVSALEAVGVDLNAGLFGQGDLDVLASLPACFEEETDRLLEDEAGAASAPAVAESVANVRSILKIMRVRLVEYVARVQSPDTWTTLPIHRLQNNMRQVLAAIEKNGKGRYRIVSQPSHKGAKDYLITLKIDSSEGTRISMPAVIQDVLRDLVANARKYTPPGGVIRARLHRSDRELTLIVEDSGIGIPPSEITRVAEFGYRATNVRSNRTCGAGFGLTKAYWVCQRLGGRMWIRSSLGLGTRVTLRIPVPASS